MGIGRSTFYDTPDARAPAARRRGVQQAVQTRRLNGTPFRHLRVAPERILVRRVPRGIASLHRLGRSRRTNLGIDSTWLTFIDFFKLS
jgi:hypothetical protein